MDCLKSFIIDIKQAQTFVATDVKTWLLGVQEYWVVEASGNSAFQTQGFKNIDVYGVDVIGSVQSWKTAISGGCIVEDWSFEIIIDGSLPLVSGQKVASPDDWNIQLNTVGTKNFAIGKFNNSIKFADPIKSVKFITFEMLRAQGIGGQTAGAIALDYDLSFIIYYKYEGE